MTPMTLHGTQTHEGMALQCLDRSPANTRIFVMLSVAIRRNRAEAVDV